MLEAWWKRQRAGLAREATPTEVVRLCALVLVATFLLIPLATLGEMTVPPDLELLTAGLLLGAGVLILATRSQSTENGSSPVSASRWHGLLAGLAALLAGLTAGHMFFHPGIPYSQDGGTHLWGLHAIYRALESSGLGRQVADLGLGMPLLVHYGLPAYLPGLLAMKLGAPVYDGFKLALLFSLIASSWTMYHAAHRLTGRRDAAVVAAFAYAMAPYHLLDTHYRGALGESMALIAVPTFLEVSLGLISQREPRASRRLLLATLWLALCHPVTLFTTLVSALIGAAIWWAQGRERSFWPLFRPILAGLGLSAFWLLPALLELAATSAPALFHARLPAFGEHGLIWPELLTRRLWTGRLPSYEASEQPPGTLLEMPFYFGLSFCIGAVLLALAGRRLKPAGCTRREELAWLSMLLISLTITWVPVAQALAQWPGFPEVRYAWRFLGMATAAAVLCLSLLSARLSPVLGSLWRRGTYIPPLVLLLLLGVDFAPYTGAADWATPWQGMVHAYRNRAREARSPLFRDAVQYYPLESFARQLPESVTQIRVDGMVWPPSHPHLPLALARGTFMEYYTTAVEAWLADPPKRVPAARRAGIHWIFGRSQPKPVAIEGTSPWARLEALRQWPDGMPGDGVSPGGPHPDQVEKVIPLPGLSRGKSGSRFDLTLPSGLPMGRLKLLEQVSPGWEYRFDGGSWRPVEADADGLMSLRLPAGARHIELNNGLTTLPRLVGWLLTLLSLGILGISGIRARLHPRGSELPSLRILARMGRRLEAWLDLETTASRPTASPREMLALGLMASVAIGFRLWHGSLENGTDTIYGGAIRDLLARGDWLAPSVHGAPYLMKPPLFFWLGALSARFLGFQELALRLPAALASVAAVVGTFALGWRLGGRRLAWLSALLLLTCGPFFAFSRRVHIDPLLAGLTVLTVAAYVRGLSSARWRLLGGLLLGASVLTKAYAGLFGGLAVLGFLLFTRPRRLLDPWLWGGMLLGCLPWAGWTLLQLQYHREIFLQQSLDVFRLSKELQFSWHPTRPGFYLLEMLEQAPFFTFLSCVGLAFALLALLPALRAHLPGSATAPVSTDPAQPGPSPLPEPQDAAPEQSQAGGKSSTSASSLDPRWWIPVLWLLGPLLLYWNLTQQRLYYLLPLLPAAALLAGLALHRLLPSSTPHRGIGLVFLVVFGMKASPAVAPSGLVLNASAELRALSLQAGKLMPTDVTLYVWNDFFAAPEMYSGHPAVQLTPSKSLAEELGRILVVGRLGIARFVPAPTGLWELYAQSKTPFYLLVKEGELERLGPGLLEARILAKEGDWRLVGGPGTGQTGEPLSKLPMDFESALQASRWLAQKGQLEAAAQALENLVDLNPVESAQAKEVSQALRQLLPQSPTPPPPAPQATPGSPLLR